MNSYVNSPRASRKSFQLGLLLALLMFAAGTATAQTSPCVPVSHAPTADATEYEVEGKITAYDRTNRTITVNGMTFGIPATLLVKTENADAAVGNITFEALTDPSAEASRSIIGGTVISLGSIATTSTTTTTGTTTCVSFVANSVYVELAENVISGSLSDVNVTDGSFRVNGALIRLNADARFPHKILDASANEITLDKLVGFEGTLVSAEGYYDAAANTLFAVLVETEVIVAQPGKDGVSIVRAEGRTGTPELRVDGANTRNGQGLFAASVAIHAGGLNSTGTGCGGPQLGSATVNQTDGTWSFRQRPAPTIPTTVCVVSPLGGVATRAVDIRQ